MELTEIKNLIIDAVTTLTTNDKSLIKLKENRADKKYDRKLHEVCINHRLAFYIEFYIRCKYKKNYFVDIEYNKDGTRDKILINYNCSWENSEFKEESSQKNSKKLIFRPDIIVHQRIEIEIDNTEKPHNYNLLNVEAKKDDFKLKDLFNVFASMYDTKFQFKYGLLIRYIRRGKNEFSPLTTIVSKDENQKLHFNVIEDIEIQNKLNNLDLDLDHRTDNDWYSPCQNILENFCVKASKILNEVSQDELP